MVPSALRSRADGEGTHSPLCVVFMRLGIAEASIACVFWAYPMMKKLLLLAFIAVTREAIAQDAQCAPERAAMVETIRVYARSEADVLGPQGISAGVLEAIGQTKRHRFILGSSCSVAYMDAPVLIGHSQTISQPLIVALMTHLAALKFDDTVLEVGTGSGYQAAVLARLVRKVCTVEIIPPLADAAAKVLRELGYDNVSVKLGDGYLGWPECGPFDAMIVTAALDHVPPPLIEQLKVGGRLVMPLGPVHAPQQLTVIEKIAPTETRMRFITLVGFVPFTRSKD
jgi:protein-L-isoaspartate(D-aspartate) O-methyltransferase